MRLQIAANWIHLTIPFQVCKRTYGGLETRLSVTPTLTLNPRPANTPVLTRVSPVFQGHLPVPFRETPQIIYETQSTHYKSFQLFCHCNLATHNLIQEAYVQLLSAQVGEPANLAVVKIHDKLHDNVPP